MSHTATAGLDLEDKIALVTGGSRGIGAAICRSLGRAGATVLVNYSKSEAAAHEVVQQIENAGGKAHAISADVGDPAAVQRIFDTIDSEHGGHLDILVNNAGISIAGPIEDFSHDDYRKVMTTNVDAVFYVTKAALKRMGEGGRIITIGSMLGQRAVGHGLSVYVASKFAVAGMARGFAHDLAKRGITSNVVQPGPIDTDMNPDNESNPAVKFMRRMSPMGRYGTPLEVAAAVVFLASPAASYLNGATVNVDGGANA